MHPGIGDGVSGAINMDIELHTAIVPVHEHLPSAGGNQEQVAVMSYERAMSYLADYEHALDSIIDEVDIVLGHHASISAIASCFLDHLSSMSVGSSILTREVIEETGCESRFFC